MVEVGSVRGRNDTTRTTPARSMLLRFAQNDGLPAEIVAVSQSRQWSRHRTALQALRIGIRELNQGEGRSGEAG